VPSACRVWRAASRKPRSTRWSDRSRSYRNRPSALVRLRARAAFSGTSRPSAQRRTIVADEVVRLDQRAHKSFGRILVLLNPTTVHVDEVDAVINPVGVLQNSAAFHRHQRSRRPRLPGDEAVDVAALERRQHLWRLDIDDLIVSGIELPILDKLVPEALAA